MTFSTNFKTPCIKSDSFEEILLKRLRKSHSNHTWIRFYELFISISLEFFRNAQCWARQEFSHPLTALNCIKSVKIRKFRNVVEQIWGQSRIKGTNLFDPHYTYYGRYNQRNRIESVFGEHTDRFLPPKLDHICDWFEHEPIRQNPDRLVLVSAIAQV